MSVIPGTVLTCVDGVRIHNENNNSNPVVPEFTRIFSRPEFKGVRVDYLLRHADGFLPELLGFTNEGPGPSDDFTVSVLIFGKGPPVEHKYRLIPSQSGPFYWTLDGYPLAFGGDKWAVIRTEDPAASFPFTIISVDGMAVDEKWTTKGWTIRHIESSSLMGHEDVFHVSMVPESPTIVSIPETVMVGRTGDKLLDSQVAILKGTFSTTDKGPNKSTIVYHTSKSSTSDVAEFNCSRRSGSWAGTVGHRFDRGDWTFVLRFSHCVDEMEKYS